MARSSPHNFFEVVYLVCNCDVHLNDVNKKVTIFQANGFKPIDSKKVEFYYKAIKFLVNDKMLWVMRKDFHGDLVSWFLLPLFTN